VAADCTCGYNGRQEIAKAGQFCYENTAGQGYVYAKKLCSSTDGSANVDADCFCGTNKQAVANGKTAVTAADGTCSAHEAKCAKLDGTAASATACYCYGSTSSVDLAKGKVCRVVANKAYQTDKIVCSKTDATVKVAADCTCGYKGTMVTATAASNEFCYEDTMGNGYVYTAKMCAKTDGSANEGAACMCGTNKQAVRNGYLAFDVAAGKCQRSLAACAKTDGSAVATGACSCGPDVVPVAKDKACRVEAKKGYETAKVKCSSTDGTAAVTAACSCGFKTAVDVAKDGFCYENAGVGYAFTAKMCAKTDGSANEAAACMCGTNKQAVAKDKVAYVAAGGTTCAEKDAVCAKTDGSAVEGAACSCGPDVKAVAKDKACRVVNKKGYETAKIKCSNTDGTAAVTAACSCGYATPVDVAKDKFCFEDKAGKGYQTDTKQCSALSAKQADGSTVSSAACTCGITTQSTTCGFCFEPAAFVGKQALAACPASDGSAKSEHNKSPERCICGTDACETGKFCFAASVANAGNSVKCRATALAACTNNKGDLAAGDDCQCGTTQALKGKFCIASKNTVNDAAIAKCAGTDGKTAVTKATACQCEDSKDICVAGNYCDKSAAGIGNNKAKGKCLTTKKADPTPAPTPGKASSYTSAKAPAPAPAPAPAHYVESTVKLTGITVAQFDAKAKSDFAAVIAEGMGAGVKASDVYDIKATAARRAGINVSFKVKVKDAAAATDGASTLGTFLKKSGAGGFLEKLKAKGGNLAKVTKIDVVKEPKAVSKAEVVSGVAKTAVASVTTLVALAFALFGH